jgi:inhibitor of cysteine peptidase
VSELILTRLDATRSIDVRLGTPVTLRLAETPSTGYRWHLCQLDHTLLSVQSSEFSPSAATRVGGGGTRTIRLILNAPGSATLSLSKRRAWGSASAAVDQFAVTLNIVG